jgi:hypothetical protein
VQRARDVLAKDALCGELQADAGVDITAGQHVLELVAVPRRGGLVGPTAAKGSMASANTEALCCANSAPAAMVVACCAPATPTQALRGHAGGKPPDPHLALHKPRL